MLDAYTVRKAIPRIVIAVIGINLSIYLCVLLIDVTNIFGNGLGSIITGPFVGDGIKIGSQNFSGNPVTQGVLGVIFATLIASVVAGPGVLALIGSIFPLILIVLLVALAVIFTLVIRQGLLLFLTVISPVAIALSILPGTEKYFKKWFDLFITTLMVYPIIAVLFAVSTAMTAILLGDANAGQGADQTIKLIAGIIVIYAPLVLIPFAFKLAGGAISAVMNAAQGVTERKRRGLGEGRAKGLAEKTAQNREKLKSGTRYEGKRWIPGSQRAASLFNETSKGVGTGIRGNFGLGQRGRNARQNVSESAIAQIAQSTEARRIENNDDALRAGSYRTESEALEGLTQHFATRDADGNITATGLAEGGERATRAVQQFKTSGLRYGSNAVQQTMARQMVRTGTSYGDMDDLTEVLARASGGNASAASSLAGFANATTKQVGRWELAPSYGTLNDLVQARAGTGMQSAGFIQQNGEGAPTRETLDRATIQAVRESTDAGTLARTSKPQVFTHINEVIERTQQRGQEALRAGDQITVRAQDQMMHTATQLIEEAQSNRYATPGAVTDRVDVHGGPEARGPRIYQPGGTFDPRDPRIRPNDEPPGPPRAPGE